MTNSTAQRQGNLFIKNYNRNDLNASVSNWKVTQNGFGLIYAANLDGVLTYNGHKWKLVHINKNLPALSVAYDNKNRVYVGTFGDFGYLKADSTGNLHYKSLAKGLPNLAKGTAFWHVLPTKQGVYFCSPSIIAKLEGGQITYLKPLNKSSFRFAFTVNDSLYTTHRYLGLLQIVSDSLILLRNSEVVTKNDLAFVGKYKNNELLLGTNLKGFFLKKGNSYQHLHSDSEEFIKKNNLFTGKIGSGDQRNVIGTLNGGIALLDSNLSILRKINKENGLISNVVKDISFDSSHNLWAALNEGVSIIEVSSPWEHWDKSSGLSSIPIAINHFNNNIYIGTLEGIYWFENNMLNKSDLINSTVWSITSDQNELFVGSQEGVYTIKKGDIKKLSNFSETTFIKLEEDSLYIGNNNGISILRKHGSKDWEEIKSLNIQNPSYLSITPHKNNLWISAKFRGLFKANDLQQLVKYDTTSGLPDINEIKIIKKDDQLLFTTSKGFYRFNEQTNRFEPDSSILKERININNIAEDKYGNYIISVIDENRKTHVEMLKKVGNEYVRDYIPFRRLPEMEITAIYPEGDYIWIAGGEGLFRFDRNVKKDYTIPFNTLVSQVSVRDSVIFYGNYYDPSDTTGVPPIILDQPEIFKPKLDFEDNSLTFNFSAAFYEAPERTLYSYYLENNEETWSKWSTTTTKEYNNLRAGTYTFHVKSKNIYDTEGRVASYEFTILPPWYQTGWAYFLFGVLVLLFIWLIALLYTYRVRMHRRRLKLIVADRTYEVISQKKEIERQKDLLQLQFEKISKQKDNIEENNNKLQLAQKETQKANKALQKLNTHLEKEVEKRTEKIKSTLHQLQLKNKELDTFIYRASHDLEGPISRISGLSALVKMAFPKDANQQYLDLIEVTAKNMKVLISKLTQVHNLHNAVVKRELIDIKELITSIIQSLQHLENGSSIQYTFDIPEGMKLYGDSDLLTIILQNIIENALVFRKPRVEKHLIEISVIKTDDKAYVTVRDDGTGIHPDHIARVFDMFYRGTNQSLGSGLGLYLAKMAIDHLEGKLEVKSKLHEYTEFTVIIPQPSGDVGG